MGDTPSYRESNRARLREALIRAARELTVDRGWEAVRMVDVASAAGVSRQTVYNEFGGRAGLAEAIAVHEVNSFGRRVREELRRHGADAYAGCHAAVLLTLREAAANPLVRAILTSGRGGVDELLLPYLTTRSDVVLDAGAAALTQWAQQGLPETPPDTLARAVDAVVRLTVSHIMLPRDTPEGTAATLAGIFVRLIH